MNPDATIIRSHPRHLATSTTHGDVPVPPAHATFFVQLRRQWACTRDGGHWWHSEPGDVIQWFCCQCGARRLGMAAGWRRVWQKRINL